LENAIGEFGWEVNLKLPIAIPMGCITRQKQGFVNITISRTQADWLAHYLPFLISDTLSIPSPEEEVVEALENVMRQLTPEYDAEDVKFTSPDIEVVDDDVDWNEFLNNE
jgi:hypothetical protein